MLVLRDECLQQLECGLWLYGSIPRVFLVGSTIKLHRNRDQGRLPRCRRERTSAAATCNDGGAVGIGDVLVDRWGFRRQAMRD
jgi:hypothetical protein